MKDSIAPFFAVSGAIGWVIWSIAYNLRRGWVAKRQAEVHLRLLDRLGTAPEVLSYLQSPAGQQLLEAVGVEPGSLIGRILGSMQAGFILVLLGLSLLLVRAFVVNDTSFLIVGIPAIAIGAGFLPSSAV